jgi:hypothetical protein
MQLIEGRDGFRAGPAVEPGEVKQHANRDAPEGRNQHSWRFAHPPEGRSERCQAELAVEMARIGPVRLLFVLEGFEGWAPRTTGDLSFT